ncbi:MAG: hypothetical protein HEEMFOPI_01555 [Holosporales bacterium]
MKKTSILIILVLFMCCINGSSMRRFKCLPSSFMLNSVPIRFLSITNCERIYTEKDFAKFPEIFYLKPLIPDESAMFVPPHGPRYSHPRYNMSIYQRGLEILRSETVKEVLKHNKKERYLFPDKNSLQLVDRFSNLPFSAVGPLWAYISEIDYINDNPCCSGSASLIAPYAVQQPRIVFYLMKV